MLTLTGYEVQSVIYEGPRVVIYQGLRISDQTPVILKTTNSDFPEPKDLARLEHEFHLTKDWELEGVIRSLDLVKHKNYGRKK